MKKIELSLSLILFKEDGIYYAYSPALDIMGYDVTKKGAKKSFKEMLDFFIAHNLENGTLHQELERLGWSLKQINKPVPPNLKKMVQRNANFNDLYARQIPRMEMINQNVSLQLA